jgi:hypothetical protein
MLPWRLEAFPESRPAPTVIVPVKVLAPPRVRVLVPSLIREPDPLRTPERVWLREEAKRRVPLFEILAE